MLSLGVTAAMAAAAMIVAYGTAGMIGGALPSNASWRAPQAGVPVFVESNGIHTGLLMPAVALGIDWRVLARAEDIADPRYARHPYVAIGWGERNFYLQTRTWADVKASVLLRAALGSDATLMHVEHVARPIPGPDVRAVTLRPEEYRRLAAFVRASFRIERGVRPAPLPSYGGYDAFYAGRGRYDAVATCNAWTGDALRFAGVRIGTWTPFPVTVLGWFPL